MLVYSQVNNLYEQKSSTTGAKNAGSETQGRVRAYGASARFQLSFVLGFIPIMENFPRDSRLGCRVKEHSAQYARARVT